MSTLGLARFPESNIPQADKFADQPVPGVNQPNPALEGSTGNPIIAITADRITPNNVSPEQPVLVTPKPVGESSTVNFNVAYLAIVAGIAFIQQITQLKVGYLFTDDPSLADHISLATAIVAILLTLISTGVNAYLRIYKTKGPLTFRKRASRG